jgi:hypothetical protein
VDLYEGFEAFVDGVDRFIRVTIELPDSVAIERTHNEAEWSRGNARAHVTWLTSATVSATLELGEEHEPLMTFQMDQLGIGDAANVIIRHLSKGR